MTNEAQSAGEIVNRRLFGWPRSRVWQAFADPVALAAWWGPTGFTNTFQEFDFRPGGRWKFTMHGPDGTDYPMEQQFADIVAPDRLVVRHLQLGHAFTLTITLADEAAQTRLVWRMRFDDPAEADRVRTFVQVANEQNLDRLAALLSQTGSET
jgi:uncharacterized protein YndB with AHSA1/START domain